MHVQWFDDTCVKYLSEWYWLTWLLLMLVGTMPRKERRNLHSYAFFCSHIGFPWCLIYDRHTNMYVSYMMDSSLLHLCTSSLSESGFSGVCWFSFLTSFQLSALVEHPWGKTTTIGGKLWTELWQLLGRWILSSGGKVWKGWLPTREAPMVFFKYQGAGVFSGETAETPYAWFAWVVGTCFKPGGSKAAGRIWSTILLAS